MDSYCEEGCLEAMISTEIVSLYSLGCLILCSEKRLHLRYCAQTATMELDSLRRAASLNSFEFTAVPDFDSRWAAIGTPPKTLLVVLVLLA